MRAVITALVLGWLAIAPAAHAQPKPVDPATRTKAAAHVRQGQEYFKTSQWDRALVEYQAAYDLTGEPLVLFNIALVHDRAGRPEPALDGFQRYLSLDPLGAVADEAREYVARLAPIVDKIRSDRAAAEATATAEARKAEEARAAEEQRRASLLARERRVASAASRHRALWWSGVGLTVGGALCLGLGAKYALDARSADDFITGHRGPWTDEVLARDAEGKSADTKFIVLTSVGGAAVITGGVLYLLSRRAGSRAEELRLEVASAAGGDGAAVTVGGTF